MIMMYVLAAFIVSGALYAILTPRKTVNVKKWFQKEDSKLSHNIIEKVGQALSQYVKVGDKQRKELEELIRKVDPNLSVEKFQSERLGIATVCSLILLVIATFTGQWLFYLLAAASAVYFYRQPKSSLMKKINEKEVMVKEELPDFVDLIILLLNAGETPYNAIKQAIMYHHASGLKDEVMRLSAEMDSIGELPAFEQFAKRMNVQEVTYFAKALKQVTKTDPASAKEILAQQSMIMRQIRDQRKRQILKERPMKAGMVNIGLFIFIVSIPIGLVVVNIIQILTSF